MSWQKGQSGNPSGYNAKFRTALLFELMREGPDMPALRRIAQALVAKAEKGDLEATKMVADRLDGKALQQIEHSLAQQTIENMSADDIKARIAALEKRLELKQSTPLLIEAKPLAVVEAIQEHAEGKK